MTTFTKCNEDGYGAASLDTQDGWHWLEVQVSREGFTVYVSTSMCYKARRGRWVGPEAAAMGRAVCDQTCHPAILADWCDENAPLQRDWDFNVGEWLRKAVVTAADLEPLPF